MDASAILDVTLVILSVISISIFRYGISIIKLSIVPDLSAWMVTFIVLPTGNTEGISSPVK